MAVYMAVETKGMTGQMAKAETITEQKCNQCGKVWLPRSFDRPERCSRCKSIDWDKPLKIGWHELHVIDMVLNKPYELAPRLPILSKVMVLSAAEILKEAGIKIDETLDPIGSDLRSPKTIKELQALDAELALVQEKMVKGEDVDVSLVLGMMPLQDKAQIAEVLERFPDIAQKVANNEPPDAVKRGKKKQDKDTAA